MRPNGPDVHPNARIRGAGAPMRPIRSYHPFTSSVAPAAIGCLLFVLAPLEVEGQTPEGCGFDLRGGAAFPVGDVSEEMGPGGTLGAALDCQTRSPWTLRGGVELAYLTQEGGSYLAQATALGGGGLSIPVERWPMLLRARLEGGWMVPRWGASYTQRPPRPELVESGPVLAPGVGVTLGSGDGPQTRVDVGARIHFPNPDPEDPALEWSTGPAFDRVVFFLFTVGFRL